MIKKRKEINSNYSAIFINGKTIRIPIDADKPIEELEYPEFYDVSLGTYCKGGCPYCYASASTKGNNYKNASQKIKDIFQNMSEEKRPFQVAIGGGGEPTLHPEFEDVLKTFHDLGIVPNYTTNGMHIDDDILKITKQYCGGVALTLHKHLKKYWEKALDLLVENKIKLNIHIVISDKESIGYARDLYEKYSHCVDYFVLLPHMNVGFASKKPKDIDYVELTKWVESIYREGKIAFGANFYEYLKTNDFNMSLYPPEIMSKYLVLEDLPKLFNNSFECKPVERHFLKCN
jgi:MoaA/NifB/PqqE/SkfB family radical SAM enzyme